VSAGRRLVDVYVVHWNAVDWCRQSVESIGRSDGVDVRIHVVDNGATGGAPLAAALPAGVDVITAVENLGYAGAANLALTRALGAAEPADFVAIAAHDALVTPDTIRQCCDAAGDDTTIGIVGPVITAPATIAGGRWRGWRGAGISTWDATKPFEERDWISGTFLIIRRECIAGVGGLDASLGSYVEDVEYCLRAHDAGWRVGIATAARAAGIGAASSAVTRLIDVNSVVVAVKRRGIGAAFPIAARYVYWTGRGIVAGVAPTRDAARRRASLAHARDHAAAVVQLARGWRRLRAVANDPDAFSPRLQSDTATDALGARSDRKARGA
jgi:GT2 family glycosyltransferase